MKDFTYIQTQQELDAHILKNLGHKKLGVDLEFDKNRFAYGFTLSLIQLNFDGEVLVVDALQELDLTAVYDIFKDESKEKVVFAFGEDIRLLHHYGCFAKNIYDLAIASKLLGYDQLSLSSLTEQILGISESGSSQKSNWLKRPLTDDQLTYAAEDVRNLFALQRQLDERITSSGLNEWLAEENSLFDTQDFSKEVSFSPIKPKDRKNLTAYQFFLFEQLINHREVLAKEHNRAGYKMISKELLLQLSKQEIKLGELMARKDVSRLYKTKEAKNFIFEIFKDSKDKAKAQGISLNDPATEKMSKEDYAKWQEKKRLRQKIVNEIFMPIKEHLATKFSRETSNFILSNKVQNQMAEQGLESVLPYKKALVLETAKELELPVHLLEQK